MATINLVLDTRRVKQDGTYPLVFRIRLEKKYKDISTGYSVKEEQFNFKTNSIVKNTVSNQQLEQLRNHYYSRLKTYLVSNVNEENLDEIKSYLLNKATKEFTVYDFWLDEINKLKETNKLGNAEVHKTSLSIISQEINLKRPFKKISYKDLLLLEANLIKRGMSINGMSVYMRTFRAICNKAIKLEIVDLNWYPYRKYVIKKEQTTPRVLKLDEIRCFFQLKLDLKSTHYQSWLIGKLIFLLRGINLKDLLLLNKDNLKGDRLIYRRAKTGKVYNIKLTTEIKNVFRQFNSDDTLLGIIKANDLLDKDKVVSIQRQKRKVINYHLKKLGEIICCNEEILSYTFRYTYCNIAKQIGVPKNQISELLGHEYGHSTTSIYLEMFDKEVLDEVSERICEAVMR